VKKALLVGGAAALGLAAAKQKKFEQLSQLSNDEIRAKVGARLGDCVDEETAAEMADRVVARVRSRSHGRRDHGGHHRHRSRRRRGPRWGQQMEQMAGLTDDEVRTRARAWFGHWLDEEGAAEMADRLLATLRRRYPAPHAG
jgi:hypothetical protein